MFDPSKFTILVQAAGGSGDWRIWHYVVADGAKLEEVQAPGFFSAMRDSITPSSFVYVIAPDYAAQMVLVKHDEGVDTVTFAAVDLPSDAHLPHVQGVPNQPGGNKAVQPTERSDA